MCWRDYMVWRFPRIKAIMPFSEATSTFLLLTKCHLAHRIAWYTGWFGHANRAMSRIYMRWSEMRYTGDTSLAHHANVPQLPCILEVGEGKQSLNPKLGEGQTRIHRPPKRTPVFAEIIHTDEKHTRTFRCCYGAPRQDY